MGNPHRGEASFDYKGEVWTLRFDTNALSEFEGVAGTDAGAIANGMSMSRLRALVWAGLGRHHRRKRGTLENVGDMIDGVGAKEIGALVAKAVVSAFPPAPEGDDTESPPNAAQTEDGSTS